MFKVHTAITILLYYIGVYLAHVNIKMFTSHGVSYSRYNIIILATSAL